MRQNIIKLLAQQGQGAVIASISNSVNDLKRCQYTRLEIKETIKEWFSGLDSKVDEYINNNL